MPDPVCGNGTAGELQIGGISSIWFPWRRALHAANPHYLGTAKGGINSAFYVQGRLKDFFAFFNDLFEVCSFIFLFLLYSYK